MNKSELKKKYKKLKREGKDKEALKLLDKIRGFTTEEQEKPKKLIVRYNKEFLEEMEMTDLRALGEKFDVKERSKEDLIKSILKARKKQEK